MAEFVQWQTGIHTCACGTRYQVTVTGTLADEVFCEQCGVLMDRRSNRSFLSYQRIREDG